MEELDNIRKNIDRVDDELLGLLNERAKLALQIKKTNLGKTPIRPERESDIVRRLSEKNEGPIPDNALRHIFTSIIGSFRDEMQLDRPISVSYLGPSGTYSEEAARKLFGDTVELRPQNSVSDAIRSVENDSANLAVVAIENSSEGAVRETHRLLQDTESKIVAEITIPIIHALLAKSDNISSIKTVYAHPQALGQCRNWLATHLPDAKQIPCESNSAAAALAAKKENSSAIAGQKAAEIYELNILERGINDQPGNETRFIALGKLDTNPTGRDKTSILVVANDKAGALYELLGVLAEKGISMTRLESQPYGKGQYAFYIDLKGHIKDTQVAEAVSKIDGQARICRVLGSYPIEASA